MTSRVELQDGWRGVVCCAAEELESWRRFLEQLAHDDDALPGRAVLKFAPDRRVLRVSLPDPPCEGVCRYIHTRGIRGWLEALRGSAARRDFERIVALARDGIGTAEPRAYLQRTRPRSESWLVTEFFPDAFDLDRLVLTQLPQIDPSQQRRIRSAWSDAVVELFAVLERRGWVHRDLKASNVLMLDALGGARRPRAVVVDLEGLRRRRPWHSASHGKPIVRLVASLLDSPNVTRADLARFLRFYLERTGQSPALWRGVFSSIVGESSTYARRAKRRKTHKLDGFAAG